jgi:hypothetical protein
MNKTDFDQGYDAGVLRALAVLDDADNELKLLDDDKSGFQRACYVRAICMAKMHMKRLLQEQKVQRAQIQGDSLQTLCEQFSLEPYQVRAIEQAHGIT